MNEQNSAAQPLLTGDEIRAAVRQARSMTAPSDTTEPGDYVMAGAQTMLSKLHIPVAEVSLTHRCANCGAVFQGAGCPSCRLAAPMASSPLDGEAVGVVQPNGDTFRLSRPLPVGTKVYAAPQASAAGDDELVYLGATAPPVPAWLLKSARRISHYMTTYHPGEWAIYGIQIRSEPRASAQGGISG